MHFKRHNVKRRLRKWLKVADASWSRQTSKEVKQRRSLKKEHLGIIESDQQGKAD